VRLLHPFMPHITEELWSLLGLGKESIQFAPLPKKVGLKDVDLKKRKLVAAIYETVQAGRNLRAQARIPSNQKAMYALRSKQSGLASEQETIARLLNASELLIDSKFKAGPGTPIAATPVGEILLIVEVDRAAEHERLEKEIAKAEDELRAVEEKLKNKSFVDRAPKQVVELHRERRANFAEQVRKLKEARDKLDCNWFNRRRSYKRDESLEKAALGWGDAARPSFSRRSGAVARRTDQRALDCDRWILRGGDQLPVLQQMDRGEDPCAQ